MSLPGIGFAGGSAWYLKLFNLAGVCLKQALIYKKHINRHCVQNITENHLDIWRKLGVYMLILLLLLFVGVELNVDFIYWIIWGVAFTIESINLLGCIHFESDNEEDNNE